MKPSDVLTIKKIEIECGLAKWKIEDYLTDINRNDSITKIAVLENEIVGFIVARLITNPCQNYSDYAEIYNIAVKNKYRNRGIGKKIMESLTTICRENKITEIFLEVRKSNKTARNFYARRGFEEIGERKSYYTLPTDDAVIMKYILTKHSKMKI